MAIRLIVNADDFGYSVGVNSAVAQAHGFGTLTSASLMVTGEAAGEAIDLAKSSPKLAVGLHLALSRARSVLPPEEIPAVVGANGRFSDDPVMAGLAYFFSGDARRQVAREIDAQFRLFAETGISFSHVDGHQHMHAHPAVMPVVVRLAKEYGALGVRVPREPDLLRAMIGSSYSPARLVGVFGQAYLAWVSARGLRGSTLACCDCCIGGLESGCMSDEYVIRALKSVPDGSAEVYCHPSTVQSAEPLGPNPEDLGALMSPRLKAFIADRCELMTYASLVKREAAR